MRDEYRGRMGVWFETLLLFVVFNKVHLYRLLINTTCLELAKPSNQQLRLPCNDASTYHCLLNGNSTKEFEICKTWKWIPEGNCAYINTYGWNIDARRCSSSAELACPKNQYQSKDTIKYAACYVKKSTNATARQVKNTTCLELVKPSNQQLRLSCDITSTYHCLLDQSYTKEFETCMMWKWIPQGKCAYFSMYSGGNIDERNCTSSSHFVCPEQKYRSENTTNYSACYLRNTPTTVQPLTSPSQTASNWTSSDGNGGNATSSRISDTAEKQIEMKPFVLPTILGIIVPLVSLALIYFIFVHLKYDPLYRKAYPVASQELSDREGNGDIEGKQQFLKSELRDTSESPPTMGHEDENISGAGRNADPVANQELSDSERNEDIEEQQPFLRNEVEDTSESPPTMGHEHENITGAGRKNEDGRVEEKEEKSTDSVLGSCGVSKNSCNKKNDDEESTDVFDDTMEKHHQQINKVENCVQSNTNC